MPITLADLKALGGRHVDISPRSWASAVILGKARKHTNQGRARTSDRGIAGNDQVDLLGALGELLLLNTVCNVGDAAAKKYMFQQMLCVEGGRHVEGPDLVFSAGDHSYGIDVKTFDCGRNKYFIAVNAKKHLQLANQCDFYFVLIAPPFGRRGAVAHLVPYDDVSLWKFRKLRSNGSPSRNLAVKEFVSRYFPDKPLQLDDLRRNVYRDDEVLGLANERGEGSPFLALCEYWPMIRDL